MRGVKRLSGRAAAKHGQPAPVVRAAWIGAATAIAGLVTIGTRSGAIELSQLAASPKAIADGRVWLLLTSGVVADRPWLPSLLGFAIVGFSALSVASGRVVVAAALAGHVVATLLVYGFLGVAEVVDDGAFAALVDRPDIGLSAIIAAWIGVVSQVYWRRRPTRRAHVLNALGCVGCALIGFAFRPDVTVLDSEHIVAFALGAAAAALLRPQAGTNGPRREPGTGRPRPRVARRRRIAPVRRDLRR
jgi:hypothetical protein